MDLLVVNHDLEVLLQGHDQVNKIERVHPQIGTQPGRHTDPVLWHIRPFRNKPPDSLFKSVHPLKVKTAAGHSRAVREGSGSEVDSRRKKIDALRPLPSHL